MRAQIGNALPPKLALVITDALGVIEDLSPRAKRRELRRAKRVEAAYSCRGCSPSCAVVVSWRSRFVNSVKDGTLAIDEFDGFVVSPRLFDVHREPNRVGSWLYEFTVDEDGSRGWRATEGERHFYASDQLAEYHLKRIVEPNYARR